MKKTATALALVTAMSLGLTACSGTASEEPASSTGSTSEPTSSAAAPTPSESTEPQTIVDKVAADYPNDDWAISDSPALALTADERAEYLGLAVDGEKYADAFAEQTNPDGFSSEQNDALADAAESLTRAGREILLVSLVTDAAATDPEAVIDPEAVLTTANTVCTEADGGTAYNEAMGEAFLEAMGAAMASGLESDEAAAEGAANIAAGQMMGAMFAHLLCPEYTDAAMDALAEMGTE